MARTAKVKELANFIWSVADLLRGDYKQADYGKVILPLTVLRRLDCVLEPTKDKVLDFYNNKASNMNVSNLDPILNRLAGYNFHNISQYTFARIIADPDNIARGVSQVLESPQAWQRYSEAGRGRVLARYTWDRTAAGYAAVLEEIIARGPGDQTGQRLPIPPYFRQPDPANDFTTADLAAIYTGRM